MENIPRKADFPILAMNKKLFTIALLLCAGAPLLGQAPGSLSADEIVSRMFARDTMRQTMAGGYNGKREYILENHRLNKRAQMEVSVSCDADGTKHFEILSEEGWKAANNHVIRKMLESESEFSRPDSSMKTRLVPQNYEFQLVGSESVEGRPAYVLEVLPKRSDKYLFRGRIWVDAEEYAVVRVDGQPAKNPSFWTHSVHFQQKSEKNGTFWFPASTTSVTEARIFGTTEVSIRYFDYKPAANSPQGGGTSSLPLEAHYVQH